MTPLSGTVLAADSITVGDHPTVQFLGMSFNVDTMYTTVIAAVITCLVLYWVAALFYLVQVLGVTRRPQPTP